MNSIPDYTIMTVNPAPAMTRTSLPFRGTFQQAIEKAWKLWRERPGSMPCICSRDDTTYSYYRIGFQGDWLNRNTAPHTAGHIAL